MGMFDSIHTLCPNCEKEIEFQSKSGPCMLMDCNEPKVPLIVAMGCNEDIIQCKNCEKNIQIVFNMPDLEVKYKLKITKEENDY